MFSPLHSCISSIHILQMSITNTELCLFKNMNNNQFLPLDGDKLHFLFWNRFLLSLIGE